jgi:hypothetical protein
LVGTTAGDFSIPSDLSPNATTIGCWRGDGWGSGQQSIGVIDDVRIYNRDLSSNEIQQLYQTEGQNVVHPIAVTSKAICIKLSNLTIGYSYQLQISIGRNHWMNYGSPFTALTKDMIYGYLNTDGGNLSFRLLTL